MRKIASINIPFLAFLLFTYLISSEKVFAEDTGDKKKEENLVRVRELQVPNSPALNLLGVASTEIGELAPPRAFGFSAPQDFTDSDGNVFNTFSLELTPYWWFPNDLSFNSYHTENGFGKSIFRSLSFSIGTTQAKMMDEEDEVEGSRLGVGFRTSLLTGSKHPQFNDKRDSFDDLFGLCLDIQSSTSKEKCVKDLQTKLGEVEKYGEDRVGWKVDIANAYAFNSPDNNFDDLELSQIGVWVTGSYRGVGFDKVEPRVGTSEDDNDICSLKIKSLFKNEIENVPGINAKADVGFSDQEIDLGVSNYQCSRDSKSGKIIFFDRLKMTDQLEAVDESKVVNESKVDFIPVNQSGLSAIRIIDNSDAKLTPKIKAAKENQLNLCKAELEAKSKAIYQAQSNLTGIINLWHNRRNTEPVVTETTDEKPSYECKTLTTAKEIKSFVVDKESSIALEKLQGTNELEDEEKKKIDKCNKAIKAFIEKNEIEIELGTTQNLYTCAEFSWPDLELNISNSIVKDVDTKCEAKIKDDLVERKKKDKEKDKEKYILTDLAKLIYKCSKKPDNLTFLGIGRYINNQDASELDEDNFDIGARIVWQPSVDSKLRLSGEYIRRFGGEEDDRFVGGLRYKVNETYDVFSSVGKAFDDGFDSNNLVAIFGIDIGFGKSTLPISNDKDKSKDDKTKE